MDNKKNLNRSIRTFWKSEIIATEIYQFVSKRVKPEKKEIFQKFSKMEKGHSEVWSNIANREIAMNYKKGIGIKLSIFFLKFFSLFLPLPILVNYLELQERNAIFKYSELLDYYKDNIKSTNLIEKVIRDEILHESHMMEIMLDRMSYLDRSRQAIHGFTLAMMKIIALLIGFLVVFPTDPIPLLITGIITVISGGFVTFASTLISSRGHKHLKDSRVSEISVKEEIHPEALQEDLKHTLLERDIQQDTINQIISIIGNDYKVLSNLVKSIRMDSGGVSPLTSALVTSGYFFIGGIPIVLPFIFPVFFPAFTPISAAVVAFCIAIIFTFFAGLVIGILSAKSMIRMAIEKITIIIISSGLMYLIGYLITLIFGL